MCVGRLKLVAGLHEYRLPAFLTVAATTFGFLIDDGAVPSAGFGFQVAHPSSLGTPKDSQ
jgi:hypothetical protein